jgi:hypothetical protein
MKIEGRYDCLANVVRDNGGKDKNESKEKASVKTTDTF